MSGDEIVDLTLIGHLFETSVKLWFCLTPNRHLDRSLVAILKTCQHGMLIFFYLYTGINLQCYFGFHRKIQIFFVHQNIIIFAHVKRSSVSRMHDFCSYPPPIIYSHVLGKFILTLIMCPYNNKKKKKSFSKYKFFGVVWSIQLIPHIQVQETGFCVFCVSICEQLSKFDREGLHQHNSFMQRSCIQPSLGITATQVREKNLMQKKIHMLQKKVI